MTGSRFTYVRAEDLSMADIDWTPVEIPREQLEELARRQRAEWFGYGYEAVEIAGHKFGHLSRRCLRCHLAEIDFVNGGQPACPVDVEIITNPNDRRGLDARPARKVAA